MEEYIAVSRQNRWVLLLGPKCPDDPQAGCPGDVGDDMVELEVGL